MMGRVKIHDNGSYITREYISIEPDEPAHLIKWANNLNNRHLCRLYGSYMYELPDGRWSININMEKLYEFSPDKGMVKLLSDVYLNMDSLSDAHFDCPIITGAYLGMLDLGGYHPDFSISNMMLDKNGVFKYIDYWHGNNHAPANVRNIK